MKISGGVMLHPGMHKLRCLNHHLGWAYYVRKPAYSVPAFVNTSWKGK
jgi:hypothetical protein